MKGLGDLPVNIQAKITPDAHGCWIWTGVKNTNGYGYVSVNGRLSPAHRVTYTLLRGDIGPGLHADHLCRVHACVNPDHIEPVTPRTNLLRGTSLQAVNARKTHCPSGHPYDGDNVFLSGGSRYCRTCRRATWRAYATRRRARAAA